MKSTGKKSKNSNNNNMLGIIKQQGDLQFDVVKKFPNLTPVQAQCAAMLGANSSVDLSGKPSDKQAIAYTAIELEVSKKELSKWLKDPDFLDAILYFRGKIWANTDLAINQLINNGSMEAIKYFRKQIRPEKSFDVFIEKLKGVEKRKEYKYKQIQEEKSSTKYEAVLPQFKVTVDKLPKFMLDAALDAHLKEKE